jgi:hypothetical protein
MASLQADFNDLLQRLHQGRDFAHASFEPVYYLVFPPSQLLEVKRQTPAWVARLRNAGWEVTVFSLAAPIVDILRQSPLRPLWLAADRKNPLDWTRTNQALTNALTRQDALQARLEAVLAGLAGNDRALVLVTDLEALHPYLRIGALESQLQGKFQVPTVFLYPGIRTGKSRLKFLGFYPEDGNYRSVLVGG